MQGPPGVPHGMGVVGKARPLQAGPRGGWGARGPSARLGEQEGGSGSPPPRELPGPSGRMERNRARHGVSNRIVFMADDRVTDSGEVREGPGLDHATPARRYEIIYRNNGGAESPSPAQQKTGLPRAQHPVCPDPEGGSGGSARGRPGSARPLHYHGSTRQRGPGGLPRPGRAGGRRGRAGPAQESPLRHRSPETPRCCRQHDHETRTDTPPAQTAAGPAPAPGGWGGGLSRGPPPRPAGFGAGWPPPAHSRTRLGFRSCR